MTHEDCIKPNQPKMNKFSEMLDKLQSLNLSQAGSWEDDLPDNLYKEYFSDGYITLGENLNYDRHRWYALSTSVIQVQGGLLGIRGVCDVFSEEMSWSDVGNSYIFFKMKEKTVVSYEPV